MCSDPNTATRQSSKYARQNEQTIQYDTLRKLASYTYCKGGGVPIRKYMSAAAAITEIS